MTTNGSSTDHPLEPHVRSTLSAVGDSVGDPTPLEFDLAVTARRRWPAVAAAAFVATAGLGSLFVVAGRDTEPPAATGRSGSTLRDFWPDEDEHADLVRGRERLTRDCMASKGEPYAIEPLEELVAEVDDLWTGIGRTSVERASTIGYQPTPPQQPTVNDRHPDGSESQRALETCTRVEVPRFLYDDAQRFSFVDQYVFDDLARIERRWLTDSGLDPALRGWRDCVRDGGYSWEEPFDPVNHFGELRDMDDPNSRPPREEIEAASDDVACKESSGLTATAQRVRKAHSREAVAGAPEILQEYRSFTVQALERIERFESGELAGPWRDDPAEAAPTNSERCTWLPGADALDMAAGERDELARYIERLAGTFASEAQRDRPDRRAALVPPPWLVNGGSCEPDVSAGDVAAAGEQHAG